MYLEAEEEKKKKKRRRPSVVEYDGEGNISFRGDITQRTAHEFERALRDAEKNPGVSIIQLRLSTPGGDAQSSLYMYDLMRTCTKGIICTICEQACSGGSLVMCGADIVLAYESSCIMVHEIQNEIGGNFTHTEMKKDLEIQDILMKRMLDIYNEKTSRKGVKVTKEQLSSNWWITAEKGKEIGFIDEILQPIARPEIKIEGIEPPHKTKKKK